MSRARPHFSAYYDILARCMLASDELACEQALWDAGELSKLALVDGPALDQMMALHQAAQAKLAIDWQDAAADTPARAARERLVGGEATQLLLALMLPHELAQRAHHENRWRREHDTLSAMFEQTDQLILLLDAQGLVEDVNPAFVRATGWTPREAAIASEQLCSVSLTDSGLHRSVQRRRDGSSFTAEWSVSPILGHQGQRVGYVCIGRDVTRARQVEAGLRENDKLRAVATLAGGVAHDFNNLLGSIMGLTELCIMQAPADSRLARNLRNIALASDKAAALVRQLLDFSRRAPTHLEPVAIGEWLNTLLPLLRAAVQARAGVSLSVVDNVVVRIDRVQLEQVLLNLVRNAADAICNTSESVRVIADLQRRPDCEPTPVGGGGSLAPHLRIRVIDEGCGIEPASLHKIFIPFFTTKAVGEGTGLGLAAVHGIVLGHGGHVAVESELGAGSTFSVYLPLAGDLAQLNASGVDSYEAALAEAVVPIPQSH